MKNKNLITILALMTLGACSTSRKIVMDKWTAPEYRIMVDPASVDEANHVEIEAALQESNAFFVVNRSKGFRAVVEEQNMLHGNESEDRFMDKEKWAHYGKMWGVGSIIVANNKCSTMNGAFVQYRACRQYLSMIDASSGEVIASAINTSEEDIAENVAPWEDTVAMLLKRIPKNYVPKIYQGRAAKHQLASAEHAQRMREKNAKKLVSDRKMTVDFNKPKDEPVEAPEAPQVSSPSVSAPEAPAPSIEVPKSSEAPKNAKADKADKTPKEDKVAKEDKADDEGTLTTLANVAKKVME